MTARPKRILVVVKFYPPWIGGVEAVAEQYANHFNRQGHEVTVLCCQTNGLKTSSEKVDGITVVRTRALKIGAMPVSISFCLQLVALAKKNDLVYFHYPFPLFDLVQFLLPSMNILVHWHSNIVRQKYLKVLFAPFTKSMLKKSRLIFTSPQLQKMFEFKNAVSVHEEVIPLSIPDSYADEVESCALLDIRGREVPEGGMLFLGRLSYYKGIDVLLDALAFYFKKSNRPVIIAGKGECSEQVAEYVEKYPNLYFVHEFISDAEKKWLQSICYCFLMPSTLNSEAFGITQLEAMAFAKPVINTDLDTGVPWVSIHEKTGITVPAGDKEALAEAMVRLDAQPEEAKNYGQAALLRVKSHFLDTCVLKKMDKVIASC